MPVPVSTPGTDAGRVCQKALCKDAYKWSNKVGAGRTDNKRPRLHRCRANQTYTALHHGEGVWGFGKDAEIERPKALQDAKPTKRSYRDREQALFWKNRLFLQSVYISIITEKLTQFNPFVYITQITILKVGNNSLSFFDKKLSNHLIMREKFCIIEK